MYKISLSLAYENYYLEYCHILSIIVLVAINFTIYLKAKKSILLYQYLAVVAVLFLWLVAKIFKTVAPNESIRWYFIVAQYLGICFMGSLFIVLAYTFATGKPMKRKYAFLMYAISAFFFLVVATNPYHKLFYSFYNFYTDRFGPAFYAFSLFSYGCLIVGIVLCSKNFGSQFQEKRIQSRLFAIAILVPFIVNIFCDFKLFQRLFHITPLFDPTPVTCNISLFIFALASFKYRFLDVRPIARRQALEQITEGILLFDTRGKIINFNETFMKIYPGKPAIPKNKNIDSLAGGLKSLWGALIDQEFLADLINHSQDQNYSYTCKTSDQRYLKLIIQPLWHRRRVIGVCAAFD